MLHLMKLEDRIVLDGAAVGEAIDHAIDHDAVQAEAQTDASFFPDEGPEATAFAEAAAGAAALLADPEPAAEPVEVVLISDDLSDVDALADAVDPDAEVIVYDADGETAEEVLGRVTALSEELGRPIESVTILSHGGDGTFRLGADDISADTFGDAEGAWRQLGSVLAEEGQIYIYGCSVSGSGHDLLTSLADATGASVYASDDVTGAGGDWQLEVETGHSAGADAPINIAALSGYTGTLASPTISGAPPTVVQQGEGYSFTPTADDADGDIDQFIISNPPSWADFDPQTGALSGTPGNDDVGQDYSDIRIGVVDSEGNVARLDPFSITVTNVNDAPTISGTPAENIQEGQLYSFTPNAADPDFKVDPDEELTFSIDLDAGALPAWLAFDAATGRLQGTPPVGLADTTYSNIVIRVTDAAGVSASLSAFDITVTQLNTEPTISLPAGSDPTTATEDSLYSFTPLADDAEDPDSALRFSISNQPSWANFNELTGQLSGTPDNSDVGDYNNIVITVVDSGGLSSSLAPFDITVANDPDAPTISGTPAKTIQEGTDFSFTPTITDPDANESFDFSLRWGTEPAPPAWVTFNPDTGAISGTPADADTGQYNDIEITVTDKDGLTDSMTFDLTVVDKNNTPTISGTPDMSIDQGEAYSFTPTADDVDGDALEFSISNLPAWADFDPTDGTLSGTPENSDVGLYEDIAITVTDETGLSATLSSFSITVNNVNDAPRITGTSRQTVQENSDYSFTPTVSDIDMQVDPQFYQEELTFSINQEALPGWLSFNPETGTLSGTPTPDDQGLTDPITITVEDKAGATAQLTFQINVVPLNTPPTIEGTPDVTVDQGETYRFIPQNVSDLEDPDEFLRFSISNQPAWAEFNQETGELSGAPTNDDVGIYRDIVITVTDTGGLGTSLDPFTLEVVNVNDDPGIKGVPQNKIRIGNEYVFIPTGFDVDLNQRAGDVPGIIDPDETLRFEIENLPPWATFDETTGQILGTPDMDNLGAEYLVDDQTNIVARYPITITVIDADGATAELVYNLDVIAGGPNLGPGNTAEYIENGDPLLVHDLITIENSAGINITGSTIQISDGYQMDPDSADKLLFGGMGAGDNQFALVFDDTGNAITGVWDATTGVLTLDGRATAAEYETALRSVRYVHIGEDPVDGARELTYTLTDALGDTFTSADDPAVQFIVDVDAINDAPDLEPETRTIFYTGTGEIVSVAPEITLTDVDDEQMTRAVITISDGTFRAGEDVLDFAATDGIIGVWDAASGTLTLTASGGTADINTFQNALRTVTYQNISGSPDQGVRNVTITVTDNNSGGDGSGRLFGAQELGGPMSDDVQRALNVSISPPHRPPYEPPPFERPPFEPISRPEGEGPDGPGLGPVNFPGDVQDTGQLQDVVRALSAPCGDDVLYECCTLEEALRIGCRFAPAIDPDSRLCNITWDYMTNSLGWEDPFVPRIDGRYFNEELDLFNRLFMKDVEGDPGFHLEPGAFAEAFGMTEEVEFAKYNRDEEHDVYSQFSMQEAQGFNDMAPGELKAAFFKGREGLDKPSRWDNDSDASEC